jgi:hypothetical protein
MQMKRVTTSKQPERGCEGNNLYQLERGDRGGGTWGVGETTASKQSNSSKRTNGRLVERQAAPAAPRPGGAARGAGNRGTWQARDEGGVQV